MATYIGPSEVLLPVTLFFFPVTLNPTMPFHFIHSSSYYLKLSTTSLNVYCLYLLLEYKLPESRVLVYFFLLQWLAEYQAYNKQSINNWIHESTIIQTYHTVLQISQNCSPTQRFSIWFAPWVSLFKSIHFTLLCGFLHMY